MYDPANRTSICSYCDQHVSNMDRKVWLEANSENVTSSVLPSYSHSELSAMQKEDFALGEIWSRWKRRWDPGQDELPGPGTASAEIKGWLKEWPRFVEQHGVLYRSIEEPGLGRVYQLLVPKRLRTLVVEASHDQWGHQGVNRTLSFVKRRCFWPGMNGQVREHVQNCFHCTAAKAPTPTVRPPMRHLPAFKPLERVAVDFLKLDRGRGNFDDVLVFYKVCGSSPLQRSDCRDSGPCPAGQVVYLLWCSSADPLG